MNHKNYLWHYGDSWSTCGNFEVVYSKHIADGIGLELRHLGEGGTGNFEIFSNIIKNDTSYKVGDMILINWSFFSRLTLTQITGELIGVDNLLVHFPNIAEKSKINSVSKNFLMDYVNNWSFMEQYKLFKHIALPYFNGLDKRGVQIKMVFSEQQFPQNNYVSMYYNRVPIADKNITDLFSKWVLKFEPFYINFINKNGWAKGESVHYTKGIQHLIANEYLHRIAQTD